MDPDWSGLPPHVLDSVLERLVSLVDYVRFSVVCRSWHCVAKENSSKLLPKMSSCPMLLICSDKKRTWNLYNVVDNKVLALQLRVPNKRFCGSSKGWLISVEEDFSVTLIKPFARVKGRKNKENSIICLPSVLSPNMEADLREIWADRIRYNYFVFKATISADPILNADDCIVVVIYEDYCSLAFIRPNKDITWTYVDNRWTLIREVVHIEDELYAMNRWSQLLSFDITAQSNLNVNLVGHEISGTKFMQRYLVYSTEKELLMVDRYCFYEKVDDFSKRVTTGFKVFYFNFDRCEWIEKKTLGDVALFIGDNSSLSVLASNFPGCMPNCIYFNHDNDRMWKDFKHHDFGVYNVETGIVSQPYATYANALVNMANRPCIWIVPTFQASD